MKTIGDWRGGGVGAGEEGEEGVERVGLEAGGKE